MDGAALGALIERFGIKAPDTKNDLSAPFPFNLMFKVRAAVVSVCSKGYL